MPVGPPPNYVPLTIGSFEQYWAKIPYVPQAQARSQWDAMVKRDKAGAAAYAAWAAAKQAELGRVAPPPKKPPKVVIIKPVTPVPAPPIPTTPLPTEKEGLTALKRPPAPPPPQPAPPPTPAPEPEVTPMPPPAPEIPTPTPELVIARTAYPKWWKQLQTAKIDLTGSGSQVIAKTTGKHSLYIAAIALTVSDETNITFTFGVFGPSGSMDFGGSDEPRGIVMAMGDSPAPCGSGSFSITSDGATAHVGGFVSYYLVET